MQPSTVIIGPWQLPEAVVVEAGREVVVVRRPARERPRGTGRPASPRGPADRRVRGCRPGSRRCPLGRPDADGLPVERDGAVADRREHEVVEAVVAVHDRERRGAACVSHWASASATSPEGRDVRWRRAPRRSASTNGSVAARTASPTNSAVAGAIGVRKSISSSASSFQRGAVQPGEIGHAVGGLRVVQPSAWTPWRAGGRQVVEQQDEARLVVGDRAVPARRDAHVDRAREARCRSRPPCEPLLHASARRRATTGHLRDQRRGPGSRPAGCGRRRR